MADVSGRKTDNGRAALPEPPRDRFVLGDRRGKDSSISLVIATGQAFDLRTRRKVHDGVGSLLRADHEELRYGEQRPGIPGRVGPDVGRDGAWMEAVGGDAGPPEAAGKLRGEEHVRQLGSRVRAHDPVAATLELQVV